MDSFKDCSQCGLHDVDDTVDDTVSPIPELLGTNSVPSNDQVDAIKAYLGNMDQKIDYLDEHIDHMESALRKLKHKRSILQQQREQHHYFLTPSRRLYPDILAEIFLFCSGGSKRKRLPDVLDNFDPFSGPLVLTRVCRSWRAVALHTPELWTSIRIVADTLKFGHAQLTNLWLSRSGNRPLTVAILEATRKYSHSSYEPEAFSFQHYSNNQALTAVISQCHRWQNVYIMLPSVPIAWKALSCIKNNLNSLRRLSVSVSRGSLAISGGFVIDYFENLPNVYHLSLDHCTSLLHAGPTISRFAVKLPCDKITSLLILVHKRTPATVEACIEAIHCLPQLQECVLHCGISLATSHATKTLIHSHLHTLEIVAEGTFSHVFNDSEDEIPGIVDELNTVDDGLGALFDSLHLPALKQLTINQKSGRRWNHHYLYRFILRSPDIEFLKLINVPGDKIPASFVRALWGLSNVTHLVLDGLSYFKTYSSLLEYLAFKCNDQYDVPFLPKLRILELKVDEFCSFGSFLDILQARTLYAEENHASKLKCFKYHAEVEYPDDILVIRASLDELASAGLEIQMSADMIHPPTGSW